MKKIRVSIAIIDVSEFDEPIDKEGNLIPHDQPAEGKKFGAVRITGGDTSAEIAQTLHLAILNAHDLALKEIIK